MQMSLATSRVSEPSFETLRAQEKVDKMTILQVYCEKELS